MESNRIRSAWRALKPASPPLRCFNSLHWSSTTPTTITGFPFSISHTHTHTHAESSFALCRPSKTHYIQVLLLLLLLNQRPRAPAARRYAPARHSDSKIQFSLSLACSLTVSLESRVDKHLTQTHAHSREPFEFGRFESFSSSRVFTLTHTKLNCALLEGN